MRTIIVDDEPWMLVRFCQMSKTINEIELSGSFQYPLKAIEFARNNAVELAFLDIDMPQMDGVELASILRGMIPNIRIVFVTAYDDFTVSSKVGALDFNYLIKPYDETKLLEAIHSAIGIDKR